MDIFHEGQPHLAQSTIKLARITSIEAFLALRNSPHQCQQQIIISHIDTMARDAASVTGASAVQIYA
jgi:hypothetical protein